MNNINFAINGLGRIGKLLFRILFDEGLSIKLVNEINGDLEINSELLMHDSIHGKWNKVVHANNDNLKINDHTIKFTNYKNLNDEKLSNIDVLIDCTGKNKNFEYLQKFLKNGVKKVIVSAPIDDPKILNLVYGVNHHLYNKNEHNIITGASCTTNCIAPIVKVIHDNLKINHGSITTIHNITNSQTIIDKPSSDLRRSRASMTNLIPTTTGSAKAINLIYPELKGKLNGHAIRVPVVNASLTDCVFEVEKNTSKEEVNKLFKEASKNELINILGYEEKLLVSSDYLNDPRSSIVDAASTMVVNKTHVKVYTWYDNEWGYVNRLADIAKMVGKSIC